jgi:hypothetical protein
MTKVVLMIVYFWATGDALMFETQFDSAMSCEDALPAGREAAAFQFPGAQEPEDYVVYCVDASPPPRSSK